MTPENSSRVLIVDDDEANLLILEEGLRDQFEIQSASCGGEALELACRVPTPDIILLDIMMPDMDGFDVLKKLRQRIRTRNIPVIFVTSLNDAHDEMTGLKLGACDYITKPINLSLLEVRLRNQLELKRYRDHLQELVLERTRTLQLVQQVTIETISQVTEFRDPETGGHINRTRAYVRLLAEQLKSSGIYQRELTPEHIEMLYLSAPLHDIGKVAISDELLYKPAKLDEGEFEQMKQHAVFGETVLKRASDRLGTDSFLKTAAEIAGAHHEKWNGSGYPRKLKEEAIPLSGRLMALADVYDALISERVYKPPFSHDKAASIILQGKGSHFDPNIVDTFMKIQFEFRECAALHADSELERAILFS